MNKNEIGLSHDIFRVSKGSIEPAHPLRCKFVPKTQTSYRIFEIAPYLWETVPFVLAIIRFTDPGRSAGGGHDKGSVQSVFVQKFFQEKFHQGTSRTIAFTQAQNSIEGTA